MDVLNKSSAAVLLILVCSLAACEKSYTPEMKDATAELSGLSADIYLYLTTNKSEDFDAALEMVIARSPRRVAFSGSGRPFLVNVSNDAWQGALDGEGLDRVAIIAELSDGATIAVHYFRRGTVFVDVSKLPDIRSRETMRYTTDVLK